MLLNAVIIVLRETLEAGVLISLLLSISYRLELKFHWLWAALAGGLIGTWAYIMNLRKFSSWFEYTGQELINASMQYVSKAPANLSDSVFNPLTTGIAINSSAKSA